MAEEKRVRELIKAPDAMVQIAESAKELAAEGWPGLMNLKDRVEALEGKGNAKQAMNASDRERALADVIQRVQKLENKKPENKKLAKGKAGAKTKAE